MKLRLLLALFLAACAPISAGPIPGVDTATLEPVTFPLPPGISAQVTPEGRYAVEFSWRPPEGASQPAVAGAFNNWSRSANPFTDEDGDGSYTASLLLDEGRFLYKFVSGTDGWHPDPYNPDGEPDGYGSSNSVLKLGVHALASGEAVRGDGRIETAALRHNPSQHHDFDVQSTTHAAVRFRALRGDVDSVSITLLARDGSRAAHPMHRVASDQVFDIFEYSLSLAEEPGSAPTVAYSFEVADGGVREPFAAVFPLILDESRIRRVPEWAKHAIWYQILVDRFRDGDPSNNTEHQDWKKNGNPPRTAPWTGRWEETQEWETDAGQTFWDWAIYNRLYGGDFAGVIEKLDYLDDLGVNALYLNPVFESQGSHKYNSRSYHHADDLYGAPGQFWESTRREDLLDANTWEFNESDKLLLRLVDEAHQRGMKVILDGVFNHTGNDHPAFHDLQLNRHHSRYADWYKIDNWDPFQYRGWAGFGQLPELAKSEEHGIASATARQYIFDSTTRWMDPNGDGDPSDGIDGWRLDVPHDVPMAFWYDWCRHVRSINPDAYIVGEIWGPAEEWLDGLSFDAVMNYPFAQISLDWMGDSHTKITASEFVERMQRHLLRYPMNTNFVLQNLFDSHDTDRWVSRIANPDRNYDSGNRIQDDSGYTASRPGADAYRVQRMMALLQACYVGAPMIWYGTEVGMFGADDPHCRLPMWWQDLEPFEDPEFYVDMEQHAYFREIFRLRSAHAALRIGDIEFVLADDAKDLVAFVRTDAESGGRILVAINNSDVEQQALVALGVDAAELLMASSDGGGAPVVADGSVTFTLAPKTAAAFLLK